VLTFCAVAVVLSLSCMFVVKPVSGLLIMSRRYVDNLTILHGLNDCQQAVTDILDKANKENDTVYFKVVPEKPDALPDRMSNLSADKFELSAGSSGGEGGAGSGSVVVHHPLWTEAAYAAFDPSKAPPLRLGKIPEVVDCCPTS